MKQSFKSKNTFFLIMLLQIFFAHASGAQAALKLISINIEDLERRERLNSTEAIRIKMALSDAKSEQFELLSTANRLEYQITEKNNFINSLQADRERLLTEIKMLNMLAERVVQGEKFADLFESATGYNLSSEEMKDSAVTLKEWRSCTLNEPRKLSTLNSGSDYFYHTITSKNSGNAQLLGLGSLNLLKNQSILVADYIHYKDTICTPGDGPQQMKNIRMAVGVRLSLTITSKEKKFDATLPKKVAAAMELNMVEVTYRISTIGFANDETQAIISNAGQGNFDIDAYVKVMSTMGDLIKTMKSPLLVNPVRLPHPEDGK
jgi:hypothetical protein